jgi:ArsR family transcriptional regulator
MVRRALETKVNSTLEECCPVMTATISEEQAGEVATIFAALADPVRLRIFSMIAAEGDVCSCNLEEPVGKSQPTVSHHTRILANAGLIAGEKRGRWTYWRAVPGRLDVLAHLLGR